jgi:3',5'-cyclic AMP phosphodiesterase CpdA
MNRRSFIKGAGIWAAGSVVSARAEPSLQRTRVLRAAHLTDMHVLADAPGYDQPVEGVTAAIRHAQSQTDRPDLIFFGGDMIMDSLKASKDEALGLWALWSRIFSAEVRLPYHIILGNHDIWGWGVHDNPSISRDPDYGKALAIRHLGLESLYYSFDRAGWHFIMLDSLQISYSAPLGYMLRLDDEQFGWLARDLAKTDLKTPVCVVSHAPILAVCPLVDEHLATANNWTIPGVLTHYDAVRIKNLFNQHPNVRICLSGHVHLIDDVTYRGVRYCCNGAVSGNWWKGAYEEYGPVYTLVDFFDDGSVEKQLVPYRAKA